MSDLKKEDKPTGKGELKSFEVCKAENGFKVSARYETKKKTLSQRAGWVPDTSWDYKEYVYKTEDELSDAVKNLAKQMK